MTPPLPILNSRKFNDETYTLISRVYDAISTEKLSDRNFAALNHKERLIEILGITKYAADLAIEKYNGSGEAPEKKVMGRPKRRLDSDYTSSLDEVVSKNNKVGLPNTVKRIDKELKDEHHMDVSRYVLLRDLHTLGMTYKKGNRRNVLHDAEKNVEYRYRYVDHRLSNLNGNLRPIRAEVFLDESYCHTSHNTGKTWAPVRGTVNEKGRGPMMVMFAAFVVYGNGNERRAAMIRECIKVWPANSKKKQKKNKENINPEDDASNEEDYHGSFTAEKFEGLFKTLCIKLQEFGSCIIHMDGASYHKRRINPVPKSGDRKDVMEKWLIDNGHLDLPLNSSTSRLKKKELWSIIKGLGIQPVFSTYDIAFSYGHQLMFTPPYHPELQPIEKVWGIVKNQIAFNPDLQETEKKLKEKLENALKSVTENQLLGCWKSAVVQAQKYQEDYIEKTVSQQSLEGSSTV